MPTAFSLSLIGRTSAFKDVKLSVISSKRGGSSSTTRSFSGCMQPSSSYRPVPILSFADHICSRHIDRFDDSFSPEGRLLLRSYSPYLRLNAAASLDYVTNLEQKGI